MEFIEPPYKPEDTMEISFNFEKLQKYLTYLTHSNKKTTFKINDLYVKFSEMDDIKKKFNDIELRIDSFLRQFSEIDQTLVSHKTKMMEMETKMKQLVNNQQDQDKKIKLTVDKCNSNEENLNNLSEDNKKANEKLNEQIHNTKKIIETVDKKIDNINTTQDENFNQINDFKKKIELNLEVRMNETINAFKDNYDQLNQKIIDSENSIAKLNEASESKIAIERKLSINNNEISANLLMIELSKNAKEFEEIQKNKISVDETLIEMKKKYEMLIEEVGGFSSRIESFKEIIEEKISSSFQIKDKIQEEESNKNQNSNFEVINDNINKLNDSFKIISQNLGYKVNREEIEKLNKQMKIDFDKLSDKMNDNLKNLESKLKNGLNDLHMNINSLPFTDSTNLNDGISFANVQDYIIRFIPDLIEKSINNYDFSKNEYFQQSNEKLLLNKLEIENLIESSIENQKNLKESYLPLENLHIDTNRKIIEFELKLNSIKLKLDEMIEQKEEEKDENYDKDPILIQVDIDKELSNTASLKESIKNLNNQTKALSEKLEKVCHKQDNMNEEILIKVKKDLHYESTRILEEFRQDLKSSIFKIEIQLREKVDKFNLDEFGRRIDNKFNNEINKKLDRNDLKINNNLINRKIDTLENKISKTLVDTLIDLQMEEAPLISKKSVAGEKCASCDQFIAHYHDTQIEKRNLFKNYAKNDTNRPKDNKLLKAIQEPQEEICPRRKLFLPNITSSKSFDLNSNKKKIILEKTSVNFSPVVINEDLEKTFLGPNDLIKSINKAYEGKVGNK